MQQKYQRTLEYIHGIPKDNGLFQVSWRDAMTTLDLSKKTVYRHLDKLLDTNGISIVYKGGTLNSKLFQELRIDGLENPYTFSNSLYSINQCTQYERDVTILRRVIGWRESYITHYLWWSQAETLEYDDNACGLSELSIKLLSQYVKYMINEEFSYDSSEYDVYMDKFESLRH